MFTDKLSIRTNVRETAVAADVERIVQDVLKAGSVTKVTTLDRQMDASIVIERTIARLSFKPSMIDSLHSLPGTMFRGAIQQPMPSASRAAQTASATVLSADE